MVGAATGYPPAEPDNNGTPADVVSRAIFGRSRATSGVNDSSTVKYMPCLRTFQVAVICLSLAWSIGCDRSNSTDSAAALAGAASGSNVLVITLDTTRADRLGCYGWERARTPNLDAVAESGVLFESAFAHAPITMVSHASMFTGTLPPEHGVRDNGRYALGPELSTLAEAFRDRGYRTGAFVGASVLNARYGLSRGFQVYEDEMPMLLNGARGFERPADAVCDEALAWLETVADDRFFAWLHFFDPHAPYTPPPEYLELAQGDPYDGEIALVDAQIGRVLDWLRDKRLSDRTLIVVTADHGESLGQHDYLWHALLVYDSIMRVPLIFSLPERIPAGRRVEDVVGNFDLMPTILELMNWPIPPEVSAESLAGALGGEALEPREVYGESYHGYENFGWAALYFYRDGRWKYIRGAEDELYDLEADPGELNDLSKEQPDVVRRLSEALDEHMAQMRQRKAGDVAMDAETIQHLRSLGYVGGPMAAAAPEGGRKNPREMVRVHEAFRLAESYMSVRNAEQALRLIEPAAQASPDSFAILELLGKAYAGLGLLEDAQRTLLDALALNPNSPDAQAFLALVLLGRENLSGAIETAEAALRLMPDHPEAQHALETARSQQRERLRQIESYRRKLAAAPTDPASALELSRLLALEREQQEAIRLLNTAHEAHPDDAELTNALAWRLATSWDSRLRDGTRAVRLAETLVAETPASPAYLATLAVALAETGKFEEAADTMRRAAQLADEHGHELYARILNRRAAHFDANQPYHELP